MRYLQNTCAVKYAWFGKICQKCAVTKKIFLATPAVKIWKSPTINLVTLVAGKSSRSWGWKKLLKKKTIIVRSCYYWGRGHRKCRRGCSLSFCSSIKRATDAWLKKRISSSFSWRRHLPLQAIPGRERSRHNIMPFFSFLDIFFWPCKLNGMRIKCHLSQIW